MILHNLYIAILLMIQIALHMSIDINEGERVHGDEWIQSNKVSMMGNGGILTFKRTFSFPRYLITHYTGEDCSDGRQAKYKVIDGGKGFHNVTILFESANRKNINYTIYFYGIEKSTLGHDRPKRKFKPVF